MFNPLLANKTAKILVCVTAFVPFIHSFAKKVGISNYTQPEMLHPRYSAWNLEPALEHHYKKMEHK